jgi:hypothetical protein
MLQRYWSGGYGFRSLVLLPVVCLIVPSLLGQSFFWVNDDVGNLFLVSGAWSGQVELLNPFMGVPLTSALAGLYTLAGSVPWYPVALLCIPFFSFIYLQGSLADVRHRKNQLLITFVASYLMLVLGFRINYTYASFLSSSMVSIGLVIRESSPTRPRKRLGRHVVPFVLLLAGFSLRLDRAWGEVSVSFPALVSVFLTSMLAVAAFGEQAKSAVARLLLLCLCLTGGFTLLNIAIGGLSPEWSEYAAFNNARGSVQSVSFVDDYLVNVHPLELERETGLDLLDVQLLNGFNLFDGEKVSTTNLQQLRIAARSSQAITDRIRATLNGSGKQLWNLQFARFLGVLTVVLLLSQAGIQRHLRLAATAVIGFVSMVLSLGNIRSPDYVIVGIGAVILLSVSVFAVIKSESGAASLLVPTSLSFNDCQKNGEDSLYTIVVTRTLGNSKVDLPVLVRTVAARRVVHVAMICMFAFGTMSQVIGNGGQRSAVASRSIQYREVIREAESYVDVAWVDPLIWGWAYQSVPLDASVIAEVKNSRMISGGTTLRSPAWTRRFSMLKRVDRGTVTPRTLYAQSLLYQVVWSLEDALFLCEKLAAVRHERHTIELSETPNWYRIKRGGSCSN